MHLIVNLETIRVPDFLSKDTELWFIVENIKESKEVIRVSSDPGLNGIKKVHIPFTGCECL